VNDKPNARRSSQQKGGLARRERLTAAQRSEIAARGAAARWNRATTPINLAKIEDFQMNADAIDAADILVTELSEQAALLSQSGVNALSNGHLQEAKLIIGAIEQTHALRNRAEQLKTDIAELHSTFVPGTQPGDGASEAFAPEHFESSERKQDRTDPVLMNTKRNKILRQLEGRHRIRLRRRSAAIYRSDGSEIGIVCTMSKWHSKNENYWYAYHPHQDEFLATTKQGYFVLGMMDAERAVELPVEVLRQNLGKLNTTTTPDGRTYWHIHVSRSGSGGLSLQRARGEAPLPLDHYIVELRSSPE
jgi:hypothetical protein